MAAPISNWRTMGAHYMAEKKPEIPLRAGLRNPLSKARSTLASFQERLEMAGREMQARRLDILMQLSAISPEVPAWISTDQPIAYRTDEDALEVLLESASRLEATFKRLRARECETSPELEASMTSSAGVLHAAIEAARQILREMKELEAAALVLKTLDALKSDPVVQDAPWVADFVARLASDVGLSIEPHQVLASIAKSTGATNAANLRHAKSAEIRDKVSKEWERLKSMDPKISKGAAAIKIAPLAIAWNIELDAKLLTLKTKEKAKAQVRDWLKPGKLRGAMPA
ncbi:MAG: hypothetical protein GJU72_15100 [Acidithiobacillus ferriphilus]|uniref:hypothetical protein n=1 Tax=Acidithiobacillus ferriphilus TaxID=1689834 RepID=UPI002432370E|nr:hypothetical protein [Acidithiobacillus ferriphilus]MBW9250342.1 hypothetical protein [Acidithiobacillus ferriphilus]MBW9255775.1 hypothetical protein [Acidithiobacillus ferriphilus]